MKRQHIEEEEEVLRQISEASDAIRRKYKMIKTGCADAYRVYPDILKPVVTPLKASVEKEKAIELKKDLEIQDLEIKEEKGEKKKRPMCYKRPVRLCARRTWLRFGVSENQEVNSCWVIRLFKRREISSC